MLCDTDVFRLHARNSNRKGFLALIANMLFVSINFSLQKIFLRFPPFVNFIMFNFRASQICIRVLKYDTGGFL